MKCHMRNRYKKVYRAPNPKPDTLRVISWPAFGAWRGLSRRFALRVTLGHGVGKGMGVTVWGNAHT